MLSILCVRNMPAQLHRQRLRRATDVTLARSQQLELGSRKGRITRMVFRNDWSWRKGQKTRLDQC